MSAAYLAFLRCYQEDALAGRVRPLREYQRRFPTIAERIAGALPALEAERGFGVGEHGEAPRRRDSVGLPRRLGHYRLHEELGRGGQGIVVRATDLRLDRTVAVKLLRDLGPGAPRMLERFRREATAAAKLDHPGICAIHQVEVEGETPYIVMRFVEGRTLAECFAAPRAGDLDVSAGLSRGASDSTLSLEVAPRDPGANGPALGRERCLQVIEATARALHAVHEAGIVHRDVKPGNIMITPDGDPVVMDFGLARDDDPDAQPLTLSGEIFGTPAYMSPEQLRPTGFIDRRTDVWSLGVVLYEGICGGRPFEAHTFEGLCRSILSSEPTDPRRRDRTLPRDLATVMLTALEKDPNRRWVRLLSDDGANLTPRASIRRARSGVDGSFRDGSADGIASTGRSRRWLGASAA